MSCFKADYGFPGDFTYLLIFVSKKTAVFALKMERVVIQKLCCNSGSSGSAGMAPFLEEVYSP